VKLALLEGQLLTREIDRATFIERAANLGAGSTSGSTWPDAMIARNDWVYLVSRSCSR
jgi:hypothetical protein